MKATAALARLEEISGREHCAGEPAKLSRYAIDGITPTAAVCPASAGECADILRFATAEKLAVVPCAACTKLAIGAPPARYDIALDLSRMNRVLAYDAGDLTLGVEPGIGVAALNAVLAGEGQFLPLAVPFLNRATIGGTLASGVDSPLRQYYGMPRDFLLGVEFITGDAAQVKSGGRVVKNVAGYDLHRLQLGALGTLGVLTRVNFRTFPLPAAARGFLAAFSDSAGALHLRRRILDSPLQPLTLDILSPSLAQIFARATPEPPEPALFGPALAAGALPLPGSWFPTSDWLLAAGIGGSDKVLQRYTDDLTRFAAGAGAKSTLFLDDEDRPKVWGRLRECIPLLLGESEATAVVRAGIPPSRFGEFFAAAQGIAARSGIPLTLLARSVGAVYAGLLPAGKDEAALAKLAEAAAALYGTASELGGHASLPWCLPELKRCLGVWGAPRDDWTLMARLKQTLDPAGILSPGRYVGGI